MKALPQAFLTHSPRRHASEVKPSTSANTAITIAIGTSSVSAISIASSETRASVPARLSHRGGDDFFVPFNV